MNAMLGDINPDSISALVPELYLAAAATFLLIYGVYRLTRANGFLIITGLIALGLTAYLEACVYSQDAVVMNGMFIVNAFTVFAKTLILGAGALVLLLSADWLRENGGRPFEFVILLLFALLGMMFMVSANDLIIVYMGLEMSSLALYVLASFERDHARSSEAGLKYFVLGALASGMLLFGISLVYGFAGSTSFESLSTLFTVNAVPSRGVIVGMILIMIGFCFKLSAAPFHMWAPDVYEGAPTPVTAFFATAPKAAALALFTRLMLEPFIPLAGQWQQVVIFVSVASMFVGALAAIMQTNIKRLLAYSSIGHAGFMLMGLAAGSNAGVQAMLIYLALYVFMSAGAFGCVLLMRRAGQPVEDIRDLAGLSQTRPVFALALGIFMFSMAGIPPFSGFFGKMYVVLAALQAGLVWLAIAGVAASVVACYYYIKIVKIMYFDSPSAPFDTDASWMVKGGLAIGALVTALFFLMPTPLITQAAAAAKALLPL